MPSARDLLQKADTLMRSNRNVGAEGSDALVPLLTDIAVPGGSGVSHRQRRDAIPVLTNPVTGMQEPPSTRIEGNDPSTLHSATASLPNTTVLSVAGMPSSMIAGEISDQFAVEVALSPTETQAPLFEAPDWDAPADALVSPTEAATASAPAAADSARAAAELAETVYYLVLQNLDLYTERALQEHLTTHMSPILEKASRELLATLNANLGAMIRQFVAEAIEKQVGVRPDSSN